MPLVDAHVHAFPDRLAMAVRQHLNRDGRLAADPLLPGVAQAVRSEGFDGAWVLPYAHRPGVAESINEWSAREVAPLSCLIAGATFHPADEDLPRLVERALFGLRLRVVKLHCSVGQFSPADPRLEPLWVAAAAARVPVVVHAGQRSPGGTEPDEVDELTPVLVAHPELRLILAHAGHPATRRTMELLPRHEHLYADLTPVWDQPVDLDAAQLERWSERLLFGSDAPNNSVPASQQLKRLRSFGLSEQTVGQIAGDTANALIGRESPPGATADGHSS